MSIRTTARNAARRAAFNPRRVFYGWWLVGVAAFMLTLMSLTVFRGVGIMLVSLERKFGWGRTELSGAFSLGRVEGAILGPIEGILVDRIGTRRMVFIGYILMGLGFIWLSRIEPLGDLGLLQWLGFTLAVLPFNSIDDTLLHFYLSFIVITLGSGLGGWLALVAMINNWFNRKRSMAMAASMSGIHVAGVLIPLFALLVERYDLDAVALGVGILLLAVIGPVTKVIRTRPEDMGLSPDGGVPSSRAANAPSDDADADEPNFTVRQALKTPAFWILTIAQVSSSVAIVTLALHLVPKLTDPATGMTLPQAGTVELAYTLAALPAQFISGYFADRMPKTLLIAFLMAIQATGILIIALFDGVPMAYLFALLYGIGFGGRVPLTTAIRGEYFGRKSFATIMGVSQLPMNLAMIFAPLFAGYMYDTTRRYVVPFTIFSALCYFGAVLMLFVRKPAPPGAKKGARAAG